MGLLRTRLSVMMFLQYFVWGAWWVTLGFYLSRTLQFTGAQIGLAYGTAAIAAIVSPFFVGMVADRFFATQHILAVLHLAGAGTLYYASTVKSFWPLYTVLLIYYLMYMPTLALTNSLSFHHLKDPEREFPWIRVWGTLGWIVAGLYIGWQKVEAQNLPMQLAAGAGAILGIACLALPHTPCSKAQAKPTIATLMGLDALRLMKDWSFSVFVVGSFLICIPLQFYYAFTNQFLNELGVENAAGKMTMGQMSEVFFMLVMPLFFARLGVKYMLLVGMLAWTLRYVLFAFGDAGANLWMLIGGILLHGICYDFFFVTGQIYVNKQATGDIRAAAQGLIALVTFGIGGLIGSVVAGKTVDLFASTTAAGTIHDWHRIWLVPAAASGIVMILFAILFRPAAAIDQPVSAAQPVSA